MSTTDITDQKTALRRRAYDARKAARSDAKNAMANACLTTHISALGGPAVVAGYMAIQTEVDPAGTLKSLHENGFQICLPVIQGRGQPLLFREWEPGCGMIEGDFGALIPRSGELLVPDIAIVPLVAFDDQGHRLGYGGGFYDRTLSLLRSTNLNLQAIGFAFEAQELPEIPIDENDQPLNAIITEAGLRRFNP